MYVWIFLLWYVTPTLSRISLLLRGTLQKFTTSLCLFVILGCLVSESALKVSELESKPVSECLGLASETVLKVSELVPKSVSECPSLVSKLPLTWLLLSLTWLPSGLFIVITNSLVLSLLVNETFISSDKARSIPLPAPV